MAKQGKPGVPQDQGAKQGVPPVSTRFGSGVSGNPGGRPKGRSILADLRAVLDETSMEGVPNRDSKTNRRMLAERIIKLAGKGNAAYGRLIFEYLYGKPIIRIEQKNVDHGGEFDIPPHIAEAAMNLMLKMAGEDKGPEA